MNVACVIVLSMTIGQVYMQFCVSLFWKTNCIGIARNEKTTCHSCIMFLNRTAIIECATWVKFSLKLNARGDSTQMVSVYLC